MMADLSDDRADAGRGLPLPVYVLGFAIFAQGTSELMLAGLLPEISRSLHVSVPSAGLMISGFAIGMLIGAPALALLARRWPHRRALLGFLAVFALMHAVGALAPNYLMLLVTRFAAAFVYAGFWAVGAATAVELVPTEARGRAMGAVAGGLTVATVIGLPAGTLVGQHLGWRAAFWAVAVLTVIAAGGVLATVSRQDPDSSRAARQAPTTLRADLRGLVDRRLWFAYATTALATAALIVTFSYLSPLLTHTTGLAARWVPGVLAIYGVGAVCGIALGSRAADRRPGGTLYAGVGFLIITSIALALGAHQIAPTVALIAALGFAGFVTNPTLNSLPFNLVAAAPTLVAAFNVSAFNAGITLGPWLGGLAIDLRLGYPAVAWIGAALAAAAIVTTAAMRHRTSGRRPQLSGSASGRRRRLSRPGRRRADLLGRR
jgi:DHA1 family chloramphenicol resistance protein-like MFS transporter